MSPITYFGTNPAARKKREPRKCAREGCENMHTNKGDYCSDSCYKKVWESRNTREGKTRRTEQEKRAWIDKILACRADDGSCRYVGKTTKESKN